MSRSRRRGRQAAEANAWLFRPCRACSQSNDGVSFETQAVGLGLANLVNLFNPSIIVLDRRLEQAGQALLDQIVRIVKRQALSHCTDDLEIKFAKLDHDAGVLGVAFMLLERHFEIPALKPPAFMLEPVAKPARRGVAA